MSEMNAHLKMGLSALESHNHEVAGTHFMRAYEENPSDPVAAYAYANELYKHNNFTEAAKILLDSVVRGIQSPAAVCVYARSLSMLGKYDDAVLVINEYEHKYPDEEIFLLTRIDMGLNHKKYEEVKVSVEKLKLLSTDQNLINQAESRLFHLLGLENARLENWDKAEDFFRKASEADLSWAGPLINLGSVYEIKGELQKAAQIFEKAYLLEPENPVLLYNLSGINISLGKIDKAEVFFEKLIQISPDYPGVETLKSKIKS